MLSWTGSLSRTRVCNCKEGACPWSLWDHISRKRHSLHNAMLIGRASTAGSLRSFGLTLL